MRTRFGPANGSGLARFEYIGSVRMLPDGVWIRKVEWPTKVAIAAAPSSGGGRRGSTGTLAGHSVRFCASIRGTAVTGWPFACVGLKNRRPSK